MNWLQLLIQKKKSIKYIITQQSKKKEEKRSHKFKIQGHTLTTWFTYSSQL